MRIKTRVKAGGPADSLNPNHNQTAVRGSEGLRVRSSLKAGGIMNHNQTAVRSSEGVRVRSNVKAGGITNNHNETLLRATKA